MKEIIERIPTSFAVTLAFALLFSWVAAALAKYQRHYRGELIGGLCFSVVMLAYILTSFISELLNEAFLLCVLGLIVLLVGLFAAYIFINLRPPWGGPSASY
jgi:cadmium resistance protein CadD (predicted permease)